jgi:hypothetical protein
LDWTERGNGKGEEGIDINLRGHHRERRITAFSARLSGDTWGMAWEIDLGLEYGDNETKVCLLTPRIVIMMYS